jgi:hypothetical protein
VVLYQLRALQLVIAASLAGVLGVLEWGFVGLLFGSLFGCLVVSTRSNLLGAAFGLAAGIKLGLGLTREYDFPSTVLMLALMSGLGLAVGVCLGDWRSLRAPPEIGLKGPLAEWHLLNEKNRR